MTAQQIEGSRHHVVIIGGGFGGLYAARKLGGKPCQVTLIDRRNFHLFQPLLYQVATGGLSPGDIASPLRAICARFENIRVLKAAVTEINLREKWVSIASGPIFYDSLIIATGAGHHYFGHDAWAPHAPGLKTVEDAIDMRRRILQAFENAELAAETERQEWLTFVIVGGGPTGVELAGSLAELARRTLKKNFRAFDPGRTRILLVEAADRLLSSYPPKLAATASRSLARLGVEVRTNTLVEEITGVSVRLARGAAVETIRARTVLWAAGVRTTPIAGAIARTAGIMPDRGGRLPVNPDLSVPSFADVFVIGDLARCEQDGRPLPGIAPVAMQQGRYVARLLLRRLAGRTSPPFRYIDKGSLAVIGRNAAVAHFGRFQFSGFLAWLLWAFVHIRYLIEFDNKVIVLIEWAWYYFTRKRGARLITYEQTPGPPAGDCRTSPGGG